MQGAFTAGAPGQWATKNGVGLHTPGKYYQRDVGAVEAYTSSAEEKVGLLNPLESPVKLVRTIVPHADYRGLWVMAYGVEDHTRLPAIHALLEFGDILEVRKGNGNYIFARFADQFSAQTALYRRVVLLDDKSVIGVCPPPREREVALEASPVDPLVPHPSALLSDTPPRIAQGLLGRVAGAVSGFIRRFV